MTALTPKILREFLHKAGDRLQGDWLLVGGTLLPALGLNVRSTVDIDLICLDTGDNSQTLALMELAEAMELPIETVNQAAAFFLHKIPYKKEDLLPLHKGKTAQIYRPSVQLYWKLKLGRASESDLLDCQHYYNYCLGQKDTVDKIALEKIVASHLHANMSSDKQKRIKSLRDVL